MPSLDIPLHTSVYPAMRKAIPQNLYYLKIIFFTTSFPCEYITTRMAPGAQPQLQCRQRASVSARAAPSPIGRNSTIITARMIHSIASTVSKTPM